MILDRLQDVRKAREVPQWRLAEIMGSHQSYISKVERGMSVPRDFAVRAASALGCEANDLCGPSITLRLDELTKDQIAVLTK